MSSERGDFCLGFDIPQPHKRVVSAACERFSIGLKRTLLTSALCFIEFFRASVATSHKYT